jgi:hypothetical protein
VAFRKSADCFDGAGGGATECILGPAAVQEAFEDRKRYFISRPRTDDGEDELPDRGEAQGLALRPKAGEPPHSNAWQDGHWVDGVRELHGQAHSM